MSISFVRDRVQYQSDTVVMSEEDSALGQRFRYASRFDGQTWLVDEPPYDYVAIATWAGDLEFLQYLRECYGGVLFDSMHMEEAVYNGHFEFLILYLELSIGSLLQDEANHVRDRYEYIYSLLACLDYYDLMVVHALRHLFTHLYPLIPSFQELPHYFPVSNAARAPDLYNVERELLYASVDNVRPMLELRRYLVDELGLLFDEHAVACAAQRFIRSQYEFVLDHLQTNLDRDALRELFPLLPVTDCVLLEQLSQSFARVEHAFEWEWRHIRDLELDHMAELLLSSSDLIPKAAYLTDFLTSYRCLNNDCLREQLCRPWLRYGASSFDKEQHVRKMSSYLLNILVRIQSRGVLNIDWSAQCKVDITDFLLPSTVVQKPFKCCAIL